MMDEVDGCSHTDEAVCPYCKHEHSDSWEFDLGPSAEGDGEVSCDNCGKDFFLSRQITVHYTSMPISGGTAK